MSCPEYIDGRRKLCMLCKPTLDARKPGLCPAVLGRLTHIFNFQVFDRNHRVVFADQARSLVKKVMAGMSNPVMQG